MATSEGLIKNILSRNIEEIINKEHLEAALKSGKKLRVKFGIDPTSPDLHLGHAVALRKLKEFQDAGHIVVLIIGDFTARVGDPSGRTDARKPLSEAEIRKNMKEYLDHAGRIIDVKKAEVRYNSSWFEKEGIEQFVKLAATGTFQQVLRRADFKKRIDAGRDITFLELLYPLFQGYDSVAVKADVELGGTDQKFNLLMGRRVQKHFGLAEQDIMTFPLLVGTDGAKKMSKSYGNYIGLTDSAEDMFGKVMSLPDSLIRNYFELCTDLDGESIEKIFKKPNPRDQKAALSFEIVKLYHGESAAQKAQEKFEKLFSKKEIPDNLPDLKVPKSIAFLELVVKSGVAKSKSEARRLIQQGAVEIDGGVVSDPNETRKFRGGEVVKIGKRRFFRIKV